jgi:hypothetical protein
LTFDWSFINFLSCLENLDVFVISVLTLLRKSSHIHALHELSNLFKFSVHRKILCWSNSELSFISLHNFAMLFDCFISWLYMRVLKLTFGKYIFSPNFSLVSYFQCEASGRTYSYIRTKVVLMYTVLAVAVRTVKWHVHTGSLQV